MDTTPELQTRFGLYISQLAGAVAHKDRVESLLAYVCGLMLPAERKSVEPMAARLDPYRTSARHQSLLHFVGQAPWDDHAVSAVARDYALTQMLPRSPIQHWILDDTGFPKKGKSSVGVSNQYCGILGKNANCQVTVSVSLATDAGSIPAAYRLYLPEKWALDPVRRKKCGVPEEIGFMPKWKLALELLDQLLDDQLAAAPVLADAGYGDNSAFREGLTERGFVYSVGIAHNTSVWQPGSEPLPPCTRPGRERLSEALKLQGKLPPVTVRSLAISLPETEWQQITWRVGSAGVMSSRFARVKVRPAHWNAERTELWPEQWVLIEWPPSEPQPTKFWFSTEDLSIEELVASAKGRWRIERDYQELKSEFGLDKYQGRGWRGFHHHWTLAIAAYAFTLAERARLSPPGDGRYQPIEIPALPTSYRHRGAPVAPGTAPAILNHNSRGFAGTGHREPAAVLSHMPSVQHSSAE